MAVDSATSRLQAYITSRTKILPDDANAFVAGGSHENRCLFCLNPASTHPVVSQGKDTYTHMCNWCFDMVKKELDVPSKRIEDAKRKELLDSINPGLGFPVPTQIQRFFLHLNGGQKDYFAGMQNHCFICERVPKYGIPYSDDEEFPVVEIPVRPHKYIMGGHIHICEDHYCRTTREEYNRQLRDLGYNKAAKDIDCMATKCPSCRKEYLILAGEIQYRNMRQDTHEWQCPQCAYDMLNLWEKSKDFEKFYPATIGEPRSELFFRNIDRVCSVCFEYTTADYLQTEFSFCLNNVFQGEFICVHCARIKTFLESKTVYKVNTSRVYIETHPTSNTFSVFRIVRGKLEKLMINQDTGADNEIDNLLLAFDYTANSINIDL